MPSEYAAVRDGAHEGARVLHVGLAEVAEVVLAQEPEASACTVRMSGARGKSPEPFCEITSMSKATKRVTSSSETTKIDARS